MIVKQIDQKTAFELAAKGREVMVLIPAGETEGWKDMMPDTLQNMLEGCMFFRREPAMEREIVSTAPPQEEAAEERRREEADRYREVAGSA